MMTSMSKTFKFNNFNIFIKLLAFWLVFFCINYVDIALFLYLLMYLFFRKERIKNVSDKEKVLLNPIPPGGGGGVSAPISTFENFLNI